MGSFLKEHTVTYHTTSCCNCSCKFAINDDLWRQAYHKQKRSVYCPQCGVSLHWSGRTEEQRLKDQLAAERAQRDQVEAELQYQKNRTRAEKAAKTRIKNRVGAGVCPCCNRTFKQLAQHMADKHPGYAKSDDS